MTTNPYGTGVGEAICEALSEGPKMASELPGPRYMLADRIVSLNKHWEKIGSHWRIRGERLTIWTGQTFERTIRYHFVMEGLSGHAANKGPCRP